MLRSRQVILLCAVLLGAACTTPASRTAVAPEVGDDPAVSGGDTASSPTVAAATEEDPMVCERISQTGTRVSQRVCMRRSQMEAKQRAAQDLLGEVQKRGVQANQAKE